MPGDLEFQMFVLDELADDLIAQGTDVLKLIIGVPELFMPQVVLDRMLKKPGIRILFDECIRKGFPNYANDACPAYFNRERDITKNQPNPTSSTDR